MNESVSLLTRIQSFPKRRVSRYAEPEQRSEEEQKRIGVEARKRLLGPPPKTKSLVSKIPQVSETVRFFITSCEDITEQSAPVETVQKSWREIVLEVCEKHGISYLEIISPRRDRRFAHPRHEAMYRLYKETSFSLPRIAKCLGRGDHTVAIYGIKMHQKRMEEMKNG